MKSHSWFLPPRSRSVVPGVLLVGVLLAPTLAAADTAPAPERCTVTPCDGLGGVVLVPDLPSVAPASDIVVTLRNDANAPLPAWEVSCTFTAGTLCPSAVLTGVTDANGQVAFRFTGGGCGQGAVVARIDASNLTPIYNVRTFDVVKSPDFDGAGADGVVNVADLVVFSGEFLGTSPADCHDYDNSGATDLGDLIIMSPAFVNQVRCQ
ncbi:MAG: hypothetical protein R3E97_05570 [Candidatus Eisenbacteria bacterium]